ALSPDDRKAVTERLIAWIASETGRVLGPLVAISAAARDPAQPPPLRGLFAPLAEAGGAMPRAPAEAAIAALDRPMRQAAAQLRLKLGTLDLYLPALLKPEAVRWRVALMAAHENAVMPELPPAGAAALATPADSDRFEAWARAGFRPLGAQMLRVD